MRYLYRLRWDDLMTAWMPVRASDLRRLVEEGTPILLRVTHPEELVSGRHERSLSAHESTLIIIEIKGVARGGIK